MISAFGVDHGGEVCKVKLPKLPHGTYSYSHTTTPGFAPTTKVTAHSTGRIIPKHEIGHMDVYPHGEISMIRVAGRHRRRGVATGMMEHGQGVHPTPVHHSSVRTFHGERFARGTEAKAGRAAPPPSGLEGMSDKKLGQIQTTTKWTGRAVVAGGAGAGGTVYYKGRQANKADRDTK